MAVTAEEIVNRVVGNRSMAKRVIEALTGYGMLNEQTQLDLFAAPIPTPAPALSDPDRNAKGQHHRKPQDTERKAAYDVLPRSGTQRRLVLAAIAAAGADGLTDGEVADQTGLYLYSAAPRRYELMQGGWVMDTGKRRDSANGGTSIVWALTTRGRNQLDGKGS